ncbi:MAG: hypothetical protein ABIP55_02605 [Tepidisphaeraceae bacterium]
MAKRKNVAALFEVIHTDSRFPRRHETVGWTGGLRGRASRWFGRRGSSDAPAPVETIEYARPDVPAGPSMFERLGRMLPALPSLPSLPRFNLSRDEDRQTVRFQLSYTAAAIGIFALVAGIALAYVVGHQTAQRPRPALAEAPTEELKDGPVTADVLDIGNADEPAPLALAAGPARSGAPAQTPGAGSAPPRRAETAARPASWTEPKGPTTLVVSDAKRTVGLHYVVIQGYPAEEKQMADEAVKLLNGNGVLCTIETGLPYAPRNFLVVGITGFDRIRDSHEYDEYIGKIKHISETMVGTVKFKRFDPRPFRWREAKAP